MHSKQTLENEFKHKNKGQYQKRALKNDNVDNIVLEPFGRPVVAMPMMMQPNGVEATAKSQEDGVGKVQR